MLEVNEINLLEGLNVIEKIYLNINERKITRDNSFKNIGCVKPLKDYPNYYISDEGKVYSTKWGKTVELKPWNSGKGYLMVALCKNGKSYKKHIHRLVLETFNPIPDMQNYDCNHINEDKTDNRLCNLNWMTRRENCNWGTRNERLGKARKGMKLSSSWKEAISRANKGKKCLWCSKKVLQYDQNYNLIASFDSSREAGRVLNISQSTISYYCRNLKLYKNSYYFQYAANS